MATGIDYKYKIVIHFKNTKPITLENLASFFEAVNGEYKAGLKNKTFCLNYPNFPAQLAVSGVKPGSQIFEIVTIVSTSLLAQYNEAVLVQLFDHLKMLLESFKYPYDIDINKHSHKTCERVKNITSSFKDDWNLELEMDLYNENNIMEQIKINNEEGALICDNARERMQELERQEINIFEKELLIFHQTRNETSSKGDLAIISSISEKPIKVIFREDGLKQKLLDTKINLFKALYEASGEIIYKNNKISQYIVDNIEIIRTGEN